MEEKRVYKTIKLENVGMKILMIALATLLFSAIIVGNASAQSSIIGSCITISSPGTYILNANITNSKSSSCINITSSNVILEGAGYTIDGTDIFNTYAVYIYKSTTALKNVTVKNLKITDWYQGIYLSRVTNGSIENNTAGSNIGAGISLFNSNGNNITNNTANSNAAAGILFLSSNNNIIVNNTASSNIGVGISISNSNGNNVTSNNINSKTGAGFLLLSSSNNIIYNNFFNNTNNFVIISSVNRWNTTKTSGINIIGGSYLGGNVWANPKGTGFSQTCTDSNSDGICDSSYTLASKNADYLPLAYKPSTPATMPPAIKSFYPDSPLSDIVEAKRAFNITMDQIVNITWYINGTKVLFNESVTTANYNNTSAAAGTWNVTATGSNSNGTASQIWAWMVGSYIPGTPTNLANITGNFWVNHSWSSGANIDSFNVSVNGNWDNTSSALFRNTSSIAHGWVNITVAGYNSTSHLLSGFVSQDTQIPNNPISITDIQDSYVLNEGQTLSIDANYTDSDGDLGTFARNFSKGTFDTSSGILSWTTGAGDAGGYSWQINVTDGYGSISTKEFTVSVGVNAPGIPTNLDNTTGNFWVNHTWSSGANTDSFNVSVNGNWDNVSSALFRNTSSIAHGWVNITVAGYNSTSHLLSGFISQDTQIPNNPISITDISDSYSLNEGQTLYIDANYTDTDSDIGSFSRNFSQGTFDTSTGILSWTTGAGDAGAYSWQINVTDGYGSISTKEFTVSVGANIPGTPQNIANITDNFWVNHSWSSGANTDSFNVSVNGNWDNVTNALFRNTSSIAHGWVNITVAGYNSTSHLLSGFVSQDTQIPNNPISITDIQDSYVLNEGQTLSIDANYTDSDGDLGTFARNFSKGTFDTSSGILSWTTEAGDAGIYNWQINVTDGYGSVSTKEFFVTVTGVSPSLPSIISFAPSSPASNKEGDTRIFNLTANQTLNVTWYINGTEVFNQSGVTESLYTNTSAARGNWIVNATANNTNGTVSQEWTWTVASSELPPDPVTIAPSVDTSVATSIATSTEFLYTGSNPIQTGVVPGTIEVRRVAVLRGQILDRDGLNLSGVNITVLDHPEFGSTVSRADSMFDMAVNGGGLLTVNYEKTGYLTAQRQIQTPWQDYAWLPDVVLIQADASVTAIDLSSSAQIQVARGSVVNDSDGTRQATLLFPQGMKANMTLPDGTTQPLTSMHVRATEYTVGANGPQTMPAELPPTSGYTYAIEFSVDEAPGATEIRFDRPIPFYVENYLSFFVGVNVPMGYYNRSLGQWIPSDNGVVIRILNITGGMANLDIDGSNQSANASQLAALNITNAERQQLANLYQPNQSLWRMTINHFSSWDANQGTRCKNNECEFPNQHDPKSDYSPDNTCKKPGSIIGCENQALGEAVDIAGTPYSLHYQSDRVLGRKAGNTLDIQLTGARLPPNMTGVVLEIYVAGRKFTQNFSAIPNLTYTFTWDGKDAYNRTLQGRQPASVRIGYSYEIEYKPTSRFGYNGGASGMITVIKRENKIILWQFFVSWISPWNGLGQGLGGWSLNVHHAYDPNVRILYLGDGGRRSASAVESSIITTVAGNGITGYSGDGGLATKASLYLPYSVAVGQDGSIYFADYNNNRIRRVGTDGNITTVAGNGQGGYSGDGGLATQTSLYTPYGVVVGHDGSIYIADSGNMRIRRVGTDGIITTVAGNGVYGFSGDGGLATQASLYFPSSVAVGQDGSIYIADARNSRIRRVGTDGIITTVAGNGVFGFSGDGGQATQASLNYAYSVAVGQDGSIYIADVANNRIRRVGTDGIITTVAGNGVYGFSGDGGPATQASLYYPEGVAVGQDGSIYFSDYFHYRIRRVGTDGNITTVAGNGTAGYSGDGGQATQASLNYPRGVAVGHDGSIYIADTYNMRIRRLAPPLPGFSISNLFIPSEDGSEIYIFNSNGRHLTTLDALTNSVRYQFGYDTAGRLSNVTDGDGNVVKVERDSAGNATAIISPYGQRTSLSLDANGYLTSIIDPAGDVHQFSYTPDGLLTSMTDPRGSAYNFSYDALGRLIKDEDPAGGFKALERTDISNGYSVKLSTGLNRNTTYQVESLSTGDQKRVNTFPDGLKTETIIGTNGSRSENDPDGTRTTLVQGPDPRFGMLAPVTNSMTVTTSSGLTGSITSDRTAVLTNLADPLSLTLTETTSINGRTFTNTFNAASRNITRLTPMGRKTSTALDNKGRIVESQLTGIVPVNFTYDSRGGLSSVIQGTRNYIFSYDAAGNLVSATDPMLHTAGFEYDLAGRVTRQTLPDGRQIGYNYDANDNVISITPPGRPDHAFNYTPVNLLDEYLPPDVGVQRLTHYTYNIDRQLTKVTRPDGAAIDLGYDSAGRLSTVNYPKGTTSLSYDAATGDLKNITAPDGGKITYAYDGSLLKDTTWSGAISGSVHRTYDNNFRIISESVNGANTVNFQYDLDGLLTQAGSLNLSRDPQNGMLTGSVLGNTTDTIGYSSFGEAALYRAFYNGTGIFSANYTGDDLGRIVQKNETSDDATHTYVYGYDKAGRLINVSRDNVLISQYVYDANGNRLSYTSPSGILSGTYDNQDRLLQYGTTTYTYTSNGELLSKTNGSQITTYQYDALGNLRNVTLPDGKKIEYLIDGNNRRIGKKLNGTLVQGFLYKDELNPIAELDGANNVVSRFVYASRSNVPDYVLKGSNAYRIITDNLGSPRIVIDVATGVVVQRMEYDEFGNVTQDTNPGFQPFGFAGGLYDQHTKLTRFGSRDYDAQIGRWTAKDNPTILISGDTNLYSYVLNDPVNWIDPMGIWGIAIGFTGGFGISVGGSGGFGTGIDFASGKVIDYGTIAGGLHLGASIGIGIHFTVYKDLDKFTGYGKEIGINTPVAGLSCSESNEKINSISVSVGPSVGGDIHGYNTLTGVIQVPPSEQDSWCSECSLTSY